MSVSPIAIRDPADPRVREFLRLKEGDLGRGLDHHAPHGVFIAEGRFVVEHLIDVHHAGASDSLASPPRYACRSVVLAESKAAAHADLLQRLREPTAAYILPDQTLTGLLGFAFHRGLLACGVRPPACDAAEAQAALATAPALVILEDLTNIDNVGGLFRVVSALAPAGTIILLSPSCADPLYRKSVRVSMGHALRVRHARLSPGLDAVALARAAGFETIALTPDVQRDLNAVPLRSLPPRTPQRRRALILGAEGPGLSRSTMEACELRVRIEQRAGVDSLNVMVAGAIALAALLDPLDAR